MRWQRGARLAIGVAGLSGAAALYFLTRERPTVVRPTTSANTDWNATMQAGTGTTDRTKDGQKDGTISWKTIKVLKDGRVEYTGMVLNAADGTRIAGDACVGEGKSAQAPDTPGKLSCTGNVQFRTPEGWTAQAASATYDDGTAVATMPGAVTFTRGRMSGSGTDATYSRDTGVFLLAKDARVLTAPAEGDASGPVEATATTLTFTRANKAMLFDGNARIARQGETMTATRATLFLADDEQQFRVIELRGNSTVTPAAASGAGSPDLQADDIDLAFHPGTQALQHAILMGKAVLIQPTDQGPQRITSPRLNLTTALDGRTLTNLEGVKPVEVNLPRTKEAPERTITAASLVSTGNDREGLTAAVFTGDAQALVRFIESRPAGAGKPAATRDARARELRLRLGGNLDAIDQADFQADVTFTDGGMTATGDLGTYYEAKGLLLLRPFPPGTRKPKQSNVTNEELDVTAGEIDLHVDTEGLEARGNVSTRSQGQKGGAPSGGLFSGSEPTRGFSDELFYDPAAHKVRYVTRPKPGGTQRAQVSQGDSVVNGEEIELNDETRDLTAKGRVDSVMLVADTTVGSTAKPKPAMRQYRLTADTLVYREAQRLATYTGNPATLKTNESDTSASTIALTLASEGRRLERLEARGNVYTRLPDDREGVGDELIYDAALDQYTLRGRPVTLKSRDEKGGCTRSTGAMVIFKGTVGTPTWPATRAGGGSSDVPMPCSESIRK